MITKDHNRYMELIPNYYTYRIDEGEEKYTSYGYQLVQLVNDLIQPSEHSFIKDMDYIVANRQRTLDYVVSRILNIGHYYIKLYDYTSSEYEENLLERLKDFLDIEDALIRKIFILTKKICINYNNTDPTQKQKNSIRSYAKKKRHQCYICGRLLDSDKQTENKKNEISEKKEKGLYTRDLLEVEHIFPRSHGGGLNKENITVACEHCNKIKDDKLSYADCYFEDFICNSDSEKSVSSKLTKEIKFSILYKQSFKCNICEKQLFKLDIKNILFYKKENDLPFHYTNILMCCEECKESKKIEGVENGLYL